MHNIVQSDVLRSLYDVPFENDSSSQSILQSFHGGSRSTTIIIIQLLLVAVVAVISYQVSMYYYCYLVYRPKNKSEKCFVNDTGSDEKNANNDCQTNHSYDKGLNLNHNDTTEKDDEIVQSMSLLQQRKLNFLQSSSSSNTEWYGYSKSKRGHIDTWRAKEFPSLIHPIQIHTSMTSNTNRLLNGGGQDKEKQYQQTQLHQEEKEVYLDYAGACIPSKSLLTNIYHQSIQPEYQIMANPHSSGIASSRSLQCIEQMKMKLLDFFNGQPGPLFGFSSSEKKKENFSDYDSGGDNRLEDEDYHPGYDIIFTSGATESLRIIGENFKWTGNDHGDNNYDSGQSNTNDEVMKSVLVYPQNSHTSVIGMRENALSKGATFHCESISTIENATERMFHKWTSSISSGRHDKDKNINIEEYLNEGENNIESDDSRKEIQEQHTINHLLVLPLECNFGGTNITKNANRIIRTSRKQEKQQEKHHDHQTTTTSDRRKNPRKYVHKWFTYLDIAKAACTQEINLKKLDPDFACVSFYKIFGSPTGIGALFVKRSSKYVIQRRSSENIDGIHSDNRQRKERMYFGGGSVDVVLPKKDFTHPRSNAISTLTHGTVNFRGIMSLLPGFEEIESLGGMSMISKHTKSLAIETVKQLRTLEHRNGQKVVEIYGPWSRFNADKCNSEEIELIPGPTIAFNIIRYDGSYVGYNEVSKLASLNTTPIQLRVGCFCNPGACQEALNLTDADIEENYLQSGHVCGDHMDIINDKPTGAVRISFGKDSIYEDLDALIRFVVNNFVSEGIQPNEVHHDDANTSSKEVVLSEMYIYPIKSCGGMKVTQWNLNCKTGAFDYDREFALVDSEGSALRLSTFPRMGLIQPFIDVEKKILIVKGEGFSDLIIDLKESGCKNVMTKEIKVCGNNCGGTLWGSHDISKWFSSFLGVQCWLARYKDLNHKRSGFENEAPLLLVSNNAINRLNTIMAAQGSKQVNSKFFRPNIVVKAPYQNISSNPEDKWDKIVLPRHDLEFDVIGPCARCSMVDIDPTSGTKGGKTLRALAQYRRDKGKINFGVFLSCSCNHEGRRNIAIHQGEKILVQI